MDYKKFIEARLKKWGELRRYVNDNGINKKINWVVLALETLFILYALNSWYGCPCSFRTCELKEFQPDGITLKWEAYNLDCDYVQNYLSQQSGGSYTNNPDNWVKPEDMQNITQFPIIKGGSNNPEDWIP